MIRTLATVLAHQGGWDEALFVAVPMVVLVGLLALAQRRAKEEHDAEEEHDAKAAAQAPTDPDER